jgi:O-antigen ligase
MSTIAIAYPDTGFLSRHPTRRSWMHWLALTLVVATITVSGIVFTEPAPVDALTIGLVVLLPTVGLVVINRTLIAYFSLWMVAGAAAVLAATFSLDLGQTLSHVGVTLYLYVATVLFAAFIAKSPARHTELIFRAWTFAALVAAAAGIIGYFDLLPGAFDLFTKFGRTSGTFKDPNVFGPFLIVPLLYMLHLALGRSWHKMLLPLGVAGFLTLTVFLSFSRGAWFNAAVAIALYGYLTFATTSRAATRLKLIALLTAGAVIAACVVLMALSSDKVSDLLSQRASLVQTYDTGDEGRFGGQEKAAGLIADNPFGIGAREFTLRHHPEEVHNVYLSMLLNAGWLGGGLYLILVGLTIVLGFRHVLKSTPTRPYFLVAYTAFAALALEGAIIDTDHWRHFYLLMAIIWGLMSASTFAEKAAPQAVRPRRPARVVRAVPVRVPTLCAPAVRVPTLRIPTLHAPIVRMAATQRQNLREAPSRRLPSILPRMLREPAQPTSRR